MAGGAGLRRPQEAELRDAARLLAGVLAPTPLVPLGGTDAGGLSLKLECLQPTGSFKVRGVHHALARMDPAARAAGVATVSAGNTAKALAWSAARFGVRARSLMPEGAPAAKVEGLRALGGEPVLVPTEEVFRYLRERGWEREPYAFVHPWTDRDVLIGHGTLALELLAARPDLGTVLVPVGGGGLLGGVGSALRALRPEVRIVAVEPEGCAALAASLAAGRASAVDCRTICDGVAVPYVTEELFPLLSTLVDETLLVPDDEVRAAVRRLALENHVVAEPSGALAVAAALRLPAARRAGAVALVTGGNVDAAALAEMLAGAPA